MCLGFNESDREWKNVVNLRIGSSHFILNDTLQDIKKEEIIVCVKQVSRLFKSCFEIRRYEDLSRKRYIHSEFSACSMYRDGDELHCLSEHAEGESPGIFRYLCLMKKVT